MQNSSSDSHSRAQRSTTLNRKYVKRPTATPKVRTSAQVQAENLKRRQALAARMNRERILSLKSTSPVKKDTKTANRQPDTPIKPAETHPLAQSAQQKLSAAKNPAKKPEVSMKEKKEKAIKAALKKMETSEPPKRRGFNRSFFTVKRVSLAVCCSFLVIAITTYFVKVSMPNLSVQFAAAKSGIDVSYPTYVPKNFTLSEVKSENENISMIFKSNSEGSFTINEKKSSWNSAALEANYVKTAFGQNYSTIREQGLTIFVSGSNCVWVNGGKMFTINSETELTKTQLVSIATSL